MEAPGLKDLITHMNEWYNEGLLDPNFSTGTNDYYAQMSMEEKMGVTVNAISQQTRWRSEAEAAGVPREWIGIPSMTNEAGDPVHWIQTEYSTFTGSFGAYVTTACDTEEELKAAMAWCDWAFTEEGQMYWNFGTEGVSYEMVDGKAAFTDLLWKDERGIGTALRDYTGASAMPVGIQLEEFVRAKNSAAAGPAVDAWVSNQDAADYIVPSMTYADDVRQQNTDISTALNTYVSEQLTKMVMGEIKIDTWDDFIAQCKSMGSDTWTANIQAAYDEFMK
jgi:putative aldouronate transport system substrate-binding protein